MCKDLTRVITTSVITCLLTIGIMTYFIPSCSNRKPNTKRKPSAFLSSLVLEEVVEKSIAGPSAAFCDQTGGAVSGSFRGGWRVIYCTGVTAIEDLGPVGSIMEISDALWKTIEDAGGNISDPESSESTSGPNRIGFLNLRFFYQLDSNHGYVSIWFVSDSDPNVDYRIVIDMYEK
jgi:hypothetical protein